MNSYRPNDKRGRRRLLVATVVVAALFLADLLTGGAIRAALNTVGSAMWSATRSLSAGVTQSGIFSTKASLARQNAALQAQIAQLQNKAAAYTAVETENQQLRSLVHLAAVASGTTAPVISSFAASPYGTFLIGAGSSDGVQKGTLVATPDGFLIGRVADVSARSALVVGIFAPGQRIDALVDAIPVILSGRGGGTASGEAPRGATISVGDIVTAPSLGQRPIGVVGSVQGNAASASTKLMVRTPVNLESLQFVYVETAH